MGQEQVEPLANPRGGHFVSRPRLLDLFCCQGGAAVGYHQAGFDVVGVDINPQPLYPFEFHQADAFTFMEFVAVSLAFDAIHASPPCQGYTTMTNRRGRTSSSPLLIDEVRTRLHATCLPYIIENVVGARRHMRDAISLHGGQFGLNLYRPRLFESNMLLTPPPPAPRPKDAAAVYGRREDRRLLWRRKDGTELHAASLDDARIAMGMPWADWTGVREAIPPAYTEYIGRQLIEQLQEAA
jgi:DNA (cytosine-5)-methyltransferase 1